MSDKHLPNKVTLHGRTHIPKLICCCHNPGITWHKFIDSRRSSTWNSLAWSDHDVQCTTWNTIPGVNKYHAPGRRRLTAVRWRRMFVGPVWNLLRVALLAARIWGRFLHFLKLCAPLHYTNIHVAAARYRHDSGYAEIHRWKTCSCVQRQATPLSRLTRVYRLDPRILDPDITWDRWPASRLRRFTPRKGPLGAWFH